MELVYKYSNNRYFFEPLLTEIFTIFDLRGPKVIPLGYMAAHFPALPLVLKSSLLVNDVVMQVFSTTE